MNRRFLLQALVVVILLAAPPALFGGDVLYGNIKAVRTALVLVLDYGNGQYIVRLVGIDVPKEGPIATKAKELVSGLTLDKHVRGRFEYRDKSGEMLARLFVGDPGVDVGLELVRNGLARRIGNYDYKYGELSRAEREAREAKRGLWARQ